MHDVETRTCTACEQDLPADQYTNNRATCRTCRNTKGRDQAKAYYRALVRLREDDRAKFDRYYQEEQEK